MTIGQKIYELRNEQNMTQEELAEKMGVSRQSVSKWESDTSIPDLQKLKALAELFGVSLDELVNPDGKANEETENAGTDTDLSWEPIVEDLQNKVKKMKTSTIILSFAVIILAITLIINSAGHIALSNRINEAVALASQSGGTVTYIPASETTTSSMQDWNLEVQSLNAEDYTALVHCEVVPQSINSEGTVSLSLTGTKTGDHNVELECVDGSKYSTEAKLPIDDYEKIMVIIESDGSRETEMLDEYLDICHMIMAPFGVDIDNTNRLVKHGHSSMTSPIRVYLCQEDSALLPEQKELESVTLRIISYDGTVEDGKTLWEKSLDLKQIAQLKNMEVVEEMIEITDQETEDSLWAVQLVAKNKYLEEAQTYTMDLDSNDNSFRMDPVLYQE